MKALRRRRSALAGAHVLTELSHVAVIGSVVERVFGPVDQVAHGQQRTRDWRRGLCRDRLLSDLEVVGGRVVSRLAPSGSAAAASRRTEGAAPA